MEDRKVNHITGEMLKHESASLLHWVQLICRLAWERAKSTTQDGWSKA